MSKHRQLRVNGVTSNDEIPALRQLFETVGPVQNCFIMANVGNTAMVTMKKVVHVQPAITALHGTTFAGKRINVSANFDGSKKNKLPNGAAAGSSHQVFGPNTGGWGAPSQSSSSSSGWITSDQQSSATAGAAQSSSSNHLAPAPRMLVPVEGAGAAAAAANGAPEGGINGVTNHLAVLHMGKDTWEQSLEDSDFDDGYRPPKRDNRPPPVSKDEWLEAYSVLKSFAHYGGAVLAIDIESWDQDQDYIIELGLAYVSWTKGSATPPRVKAEHIIIEEHRDKRNGIYSPDAKDRFAFGRSKTLSEFDSQVYLRMLMNKLGDTQPLILLFHNAAAEKAYFEMMNISDLANLPENRMPMSFLRPTTSTFKKNEWKGKVILDTQRLWKAYLIGTQEAKDAPLALGKICKQLKVSTTYLHNAGNDALYTLKILTTLAQLQSKKDEEARLGQGA